MIGIEVTVFLLLTIGGLLLFLRKNMDINFEKAYLKERRERITKRKVSKSELLKIKIEGVVKQSGHDMKTFLFSCIAASVAGFAVGYLLFSGAALAFAAALAMMPSPYLFFYLKSAKVRRVEIDNLEQTMSVITSAYASSFDIVTAVEGFNRERNRGIPAHLRKLTPFDIFYTNATLTFNSVDSSLIILETMINNHYFSDWVKTLRMCSKDRNMVFALQPIIQAMSDAKAAQIEADTKIERAWRDYILTVVVMFGIIPMLRMVNREWYSILVNTVIGRLLILLMLASALLSAFFVTKIAKN